MKRLKLERLKKEMSQYELAKKAGISVQYLAKLEKGKKNNPSLIVMNNIATALNKSVQELFLEDN